jgi:hypothetical protein
MTTFDPRTVRPTYADQSYGAQQFPGQQFPGPVPPPPSRPSRKPRPLAAKIVAGLVVAGVVAGGAGTVMALSGAPAEAAVQSTSFAGANPTTSPFGTDNPEVATVAATGQQAGDTPAMYAATTPPSCNNADFLSQLQADPNKLAAFGGVFGIGPTDVPAFVDSLSPVVLRAATSVTDHPFTDGAFVEQRAVLAAGTAVLVNSYGEPTVKCFNGNPLTAGAPASDAVTVAPTATAMTTFAFTTIDNSGPVVVTTPPDPKPIPGPNPTPLTGRYNYDGSVMLSDGRIELPDGRILTPKATIPAGGFKNPDGSVTVNGKVFNPDGTERKPITIPARFEVINGHFHFIPGFTIRTDGVAVDTTGNPLAPQPKVIRNYDGTATVIKDNKVEVRNPDGTTKSSTTVNPPNTINPDGSIKTPTGVLNPDGTTPRKDVDLPDGTTTTPNGGETFAANTANAHGSLLNKDGSLPAGATKNADGTFTLKDGTVLNHDGSVKTPASKVLPKGGVLNPAGGVIDPNVSKVPASNCGIVADSAIAACKLPTGSADTTPATGGTTGSTTSGSTSTGSTGGTGSSTSSSGSSTSSTGGSQSPAKGGSDK